jgi:hypothetical protein
MKYLKILLVIISFSGITFGEEAEVISAAKLQEIQKGMQQMRDLLQQAPNLPPEEAIPLLGLAVYKTSHNRIYKVPERVELHDQLEQALIAIPGHAEYYQNKINTAQENLDRSIEVSTTSGTNRTENLKSVLRSAQNDGFMILGELPSPETIRVLGEMLFDERGVIKKENASDNSDAFLMQTPTSQLAASLLEKMIESPPLIDLPGTYFSDLGPWKNWYHQVKEGNRTYRFKGNPTEYDLNGPVRATKTPDAKRSDRRAITDSSAETKKKGGSNAPTITAIIIAVLIGGGYWIYRRKSMA